MYYKHCTFGCEPRGEFLHTVVLWVCTKDKGGSQTILILLNNEAVQAGYAEQKQFSLVETPSPICNGSLYYNL